MIRVGVVGHIESIRFAVVPRLPVPGEILHASQVFDLTAGGGAVAAVQLAKLAGTASFHTAVGGDELGSLAVAELQRLGVEVSAAVHAEESTRRAFVYLDEAHERTITILDPRVVPYETDPLPWSRLALLDGIYFTGGDAGTLRAARSAKVVVATSRAIMTCREAAIELDAIVFSANDAGEAFDPDDLDPKPKLTVATRGADGGTWRTRDGESGTWDPEPLPGPQVDAYGSGDSFAAGLTYGLAAGMTPGDAVRLGARCGAYCLCGRGPYEGQLTL